MADLLFDVAILAIDVGLTCYALSSVYSAGSRVLKHFKPIDKQKTIFIKLPCQCQSSLHRPIEKEDRTEKEHDEISKEHCC